ncbi:MAG: competence/damage-inducible protein A [Bacteroidota bacterium]
MTAHVITIGDELLIGQVLNTNQAFIGERLSAIGVRTVAMTTVGDDIEAIQSEFRRAWESCPVVIVTGGLGPTHDDITKHAVCQFFGMELVSNPDIRRRVEELLSRRNLPWTPAAEDQTMVPRGAEVIANPIGTAPGVRISRDARHFIVLPGVPYEMEEMLTRSVIPFLAPLIRGQAISHRTLRTTGIPESFLAQQLGDLDTLLQGSSLAFLPSPAGVRLRITVLAATAEEAERRVAEAELRIRAKVGKYVYGTGEEELEDVLGRILRERKMTIAVAESCTGGLITHRITNVGGSSDYLERGVVAYSNVSKTELLGVPPEIIATHGAVSKETALAMAEGIRKIARADIGLSTTGIAGPTGGSLEKPVGLVWIGCADPSGSIAVKFHFGEGRTRVKERASQAAMELVRRRIMKIV